MPGQVKVCTYNVHHCYTGAGKYSFQQIVDTIAAISPDILCLQVSSVRIIVM